MKRSLSLTFGAALLGLLVDAGTPRLGAGVIYSNFGPGMAFDTTLEHGWTINGFFAPTIGRQAISQQFTPLVPCVFTDAQLAIQHLSGPMSFVVFLQADSSGFPGTVIERIDVTVTAGSQSIVTAMSALQPELQAGIGYWLTLVGEEPGVLGGWKWNVVGDIATTSFAGTQGGSWAGPWHHPPSPSAYTRGAFQIDGVPLAPQALDHLLALVESRCPRPQPLCAILDAALAALDRDNSRVAVNQLQAFQNKTRAQVMPSDPVLAQLLIQAAEQVIGALQMSP